MKILVPTTTFPRHPNDKIPQFLFGYTRALAAVGASVTVIAPHDVGVPTYEIMDGVEVRRVAYWLPKSAQKLCYGAGIPTNVRRRKWLALQFLPLEAVFLRAVLRYGRDADILNPHWTFASLPTAAAAHILKKPMVTHAYTAEYIPRVLRPFNRLINRRSCATISISAYAAKLVEGTGSPRRHEIIGFGVNPEKIAPPGFDRMAFRAEHGIQPDEMLIFAVGRLVERKGYPVLVDAVARLMRRGRRVRLLHSGTGPMYEEIQSQVAAHNLQDRARLLGFVPDEALRHYIKAADVLVMPSIRDQSKDTEGLGIPLLEAMANGTPAIGSAIGGILSIIDDGVNGLLFPPGDVDGLVDALERLEDDDALRTRIIEGGRQTVDTTYDWGVITQRLMAIFEDCLRDEIG